MVKNNNAVAIMLPVRSWYLLCVSIWCLSVMGQYLSTCVPRGTVKNFSHRLCVCVNRGCADLAAKKAVFRSAGGVYESCFGSEVRKTVWFYVLMVLTYLLCLHVSPPLLF